MSGPTAAWSTRDLVGSLARSSWGDLDGPKHAGVRRVLIAVVELLPYASGTGKCTAAQVADAAGGLSLRWTRRCLHVLESLGIITWARGWLDRGRPRPGVIKIVKTALVGLIKAARRAGIRDARRRARAEDLRDRLNGLDWITQTPTSWRRNKRNPLSRRAEVSSPLPFHREVSGAAQRPPQPRKDAPPMGRARCIHDQDAEYCDFCLGMKKAPEGYRFEWDRCNACGRTPYMHDIVEAKTAPEYRHDFHPTLTRTRW